MDSVISGVSSELLSRPGMQVVNPEDAEGLLGEAFATAVAEAEALCKVQDPEDEPYRSKYAAREKLNALCNQMEAHRTVASLERKAETVMQLDWRIAALEVRLAGIAWDCEEPHNCQKELDLAVEYYFPGAKAEIEKLAADGDGLSDDASGPPVSMQELDALVPPALDAPRPQVCADAVQCLNLMGILWAGRGFVKRSFLYLLATKNLYERCKDLPLSASDRKELESVFTNNLFYLAQAYGNCGNMKLSSQYCHMTLQRQLDASLGSEAAAFEWCKNCVGISDFYLNMQYFQRCSDVLAAIEAVLLHRFHDLSILALPSAPLQPTTTSTPPAAPEAYSPPPAPTASPPVYNMKSPHLVPFTASVESNADLKSRLEEMEADLCRRWAHLDAIVLKIAYDAAVGNIESPDSAGNQAGESQSGPCFSNLPIPPRVVVVNLPRELTGFDAARSVFLRAAAKIESAKKYFVLDGFVSDHIRLLEEHSRLYHHLAVFERDVKRRAAMEAKRLELLKPLLPELSMVAYETQHKQISFELGEVYITLLDLLAEKYTGSNPAETGPMAFVETRMSAADVGKSNEYCLGGISMFAHFTKMYAKRDARSGTTPSQNFSTVSTFEAALNPGCTEPDESLLNADELRPFLTAHFHLCRLISKLTPVAPVGGAKQATHVQFLAAALKRYEWLDKAAVKYCASKEVNIDDVFSTELSLCREMVALLPTRINRMHYLGAAS